MALGQPRALAVAAMLAIRPGRAVAFEEFIDGVFGTSLPTRPRQAIHTHVSRLRRALGADAITTVGNGTGYVMRLAPEDLDLWQCEQLLETARNQRSAGAVVLAADGYQSALRLLDCGALTGVPGPAADATRTRLAEVRLSALEDWLELRLHLGQHSAVAAELAGLVESHPLRERLHQLLMLARYRCGRQAEALAVHADLRRLLDEELGIRPSAETDEIFRRILRHDPDLAAPAPKHADTAEPVPQAPARRSGPAEAGARPARPTPLVPRQLPAALAGFVGRREELAVLVGALIGPCADSPVVAAATGMGGVGKSTLAVRAAHTASERYPDGQLYLDLRGAGADPIEPRDALTVMLRAFDVTAPAEAGVEELAALYRSVTADRRILVLLDDAADAAQASPLMPGTPGSAVLVTSRRVLPELAADCVLEVDVFDEAQALELLGVVADTSRIAAEPAAAAEVAGFCGGLPLALRIAGTRLAGRRGWTIRSLADRLADERGRLGELHAGRMAVAPVFELGYAQLGQEQARAFRLIGAVNTPDMPLPALAALLDRPRSVAEAVAESLVDVGMAQSPAPGRYRLHDLLRLFAGELTPGPGSDSGPDPHEAPRAVSRLTEHYRAHVDAAANLLYPHLLALPDDRSARDDDGEPAAFRDGTAALAWLDRERSNLVALIKVLSGGRDPAAAWRLADRMTGYFVLRSDVAAWRAAAEAAYEAATSKCDLRAQAAVELSLGMADWYQARHESAARRYRSAAALAEQSGWTECHAVALNNLAGCLWTAGQADETVASLAQALELHRRCGRTSGEAATLANLGAAQVELGGRLSPGADRQAALRLAVSQLTQALALHRSIADRRGEPLTLRTLAEAHREAGDYDQAAAAADLACGLAHDAEDTRVEARVLGTRGTVYVLKGEEALGLDHHSKAIELAELIGSPLILAEAHLAFASSLTAMGRFSEATRHIDGAEDLAAAVGSALLTRRCHSARARVETKRRASDATAARVAN